MSAAALAPGFSRWLASALGFMLAFGGMALGARSALTGRGRTGDLEIEFGLVQIHAHHAHAQLVAETIDLARALAHQAMMGRIKMIVIVAERRDVYQAAHVDFHEFDKKSEVRDAADDAV